MNVLKPLAAAAVLIAAMATAAPADAHGYYGYRGYWYGGPAVRFYYGGPLWWGGGYYYGPPYGSPYGYAPVPPVVVSPPSPPVYIERDQEPAPVPSAPAPSAPAAPSAAPATQWWYLCSNPRGAYPYVRECPGGWERVPALPPGATR
jgi:hypothetical protein